MSYSTTRNDVKTHIQQIEALAKDVRDKLDSNGDFMDTANELVRNALTLVFDLGSFYTTQQSGTNKAVAGTVVSNPSGTSRYSNYHNLRDNRGRFIRKV